MEHENKQTNVPQPVVDFVNKKISDLRSKITTKYSNYKANNIIGSTIKRFSTNDNVFNIHIDFDRLTLSQSEFEHLKPLILHCESSSIYLHESVVFNPETGKVNWL